MGGHAATGGACSKRWAGMQQLVGHAASGGHEATGGACSKRWACSNWCGMQQAVGMQQLVRHAASGGHAATGRHAPCGGHASGSRQTVVDMEKRSLSAVRRLLGQEKTIIGNQRVTGTYI